MFLEDFPAEIIVNIFHSCPSLQDLVHLSATCSRFRKILNGHGKLDMLASAVDAQFGPLEDIIQLVTYNASQPAHFLRKAPLSMALLQQAVEKGRIATRWEDVYPFKKWKYDYENRRFLTSAERLRLRRAIYRLWLYALAYHNESHSRQTRLRRLVVLSRAALLQNWTTCELAEIADVQRILREVIKSNICPANGTVVRRFRDRFPDLDYQLAFNVHFNLPPPATSVFQSTFYAQHQVSTARGNQYVKYRPTSHYESGSEGWGDDITNYYVVEDMLKLNPEQILFLKEGEVTKFEVECYVKSLGEWFENNGQTWNETLEWVLMSRNDCCEVPLYESIESGELGIVLGDIEPAMTAASGR